jgi:hypothetical protein
MRRTRCTKVDLVYGDERRETLSSAEGDTEDERRIAEAFNKTRKKADRRLEQGETKLKRREEKRRHKQRQNRRQGRKPSS